MVHSNYSSYDVLKGYAHWDKKTQEVLNKRVELKNNLEFFNSLEEKLMRSLINRLVFEKRQNLISRVLESIDYNLAKGIGDGYRKVGIPDDQNFYRMGLEAIEETAKIMYVGASFVDLHSKEQDEVLVKIAEGNPPGAIWNSIKAKDFFKKLLKDVAKIYYSQPEIWTEIGYGGPAYPRGYVRIELGGIDPWEAVRHETT